MNDHDGTWHEHNEIESLRAEIERLRALHSPEARENARTVLREYVAGLKDGGSYQMAEDEALDKLGFGEIFTGGPWALTPGERHD